MTNQFLSSITYIVKTRFCEETQEFQQSVRKQKKQSDLRIAITLHEKYSGRKQHYIR